MPEKDIFFNLIIFKLHKLLQILLKMPVEAVSSIPNPSIFVQVN